MWLFTKGTNGTNNAIIPKKENPERVSGYRPISLSNVSYKFIARLLTTRFRMILSKIISSLQTAFFPKRDIHDNILVVHEILSTFSVNSPKNEYMTIKLDEEKV